MNNPISAYALHILNNKHEYGNAGQTIQLIKPCNKGNKMNYFKFTYCRISRCIYSHVNILLIQITKSIWATFYQQQRHKYLNLIIFNEILIIYGVIKKSLCTCFLYSNYQMHRDFFDHSVESM